MSERVLASPTVKKSPDVVGESGQALSDRPEAIEPQGVHGRSWPESKNYI